MTANDEWDTRRVLTNWSGQQDDGGSSPVDLASTFLSCVLVGAGPMGGQGLLGLSETVEYMRGCIMLHSHKMDDDAMECMEPYLSLSHNSHVK